MVAGGGALTSVLSGAPASATTKVPLLVKRPSSVVGSLPKALQQYYELATTTPLGPSLFHNWKPKRKPPWKIGFAKFFCRKLLEDRNSNAASTIISFRRTRRLASLVK